MVATKDGNVMMYYVILYVTSLVLTGWIIHHSIHGNRWPCQDTLKIVHHLYLHSVLVNGNVHVRKERRHWDEILIFGTYRLIINNSIHGSKEQIDMYWR